MVITERAEVAARGVEHRATYDVVACRGFGPPALTIECSAGFLSPGGTLLISEPPDRRFWNPIALASVGLEHTDTHDGIARFTRIGELPASAPRPYTTT